MALLKTQQSRHRALLSALMLFVVPGFARAQAILLADDFESPNLLSTASPPGVWSYVGSTEASNTLTQSAVAAHRGSAGLSLNDINTGTGAGQVTWIEASGVPDGQGAIHFRTWVKLVTPNPTQEFSILMIHGTVPGSTLAELRLDPNGNPGLGGVDNSAAYIFSNLGTNTFSVGAWHLIEIAAKGVGTATGSRELWIDGTKVLARTNLDWSGRSYISVLAGMPWGDHAWTGQMYLDDPRVTDGPPATTLSIRTTAPGLPPQGGCQPAVIELIDGPGALAPAPYAVIAALSDSSGGTFYGNATCTGAPQSSLTLAAGSSSASVHWKPMATGTATLTATQLDFLTSSFQTTVVSPAPDAGTPDAGAVDAGGGSGVSQLLGDDFESGLQLPNSSSVGVWSALGNNEASNTFGIAPQAAHRGQAGLLLDDVTAGTGAGQSNWLEGTGVPDLTGDIHFRSWVQLNTVDATDGFIAMMIQGNVPAATLAELRMNPGGSIGVGGYNGTGLYQYADVPLAVFVAGGWHLVELVAKGVGSAGGTRELWIDGALLVSQNNLDWNGRLYKKVQLGTPWGTFAWTGQLFFDDARVTHGPTPSLLSIRLSSASGAAVGSCVPVSVELRDVAGSLAPAPYPMAAELSDSSGGTFHLGADCLGLPQSSVALFAGTQDAALFWRPAVEGPTTLLAQQVDFLPRPAQVMVGPGTAADGGTVNPADGGTVNPADGGVSVPSAPSNGGGRGEALWLRVGCAASPSPLRWGPLLMGLLTASWLSRRRRAVRPRPVGR